MFLKKVQLFGFKSFADRVTLEFSDGITALLGPNGCGKSNIVDSIKWVLGEQSIKTLRAGQMEDVIFNGTETRKSLNIAEVTLTIANESGNLPLDIPEIEIRRRIFRGGENEYSLNGTPVRLKEIRELFYDTGIGKSAYSILEQGKIDQILSHRPEDRRYIFEEAAGITRFKQKSAEAERKLAKTDENLLQVENILREVRKTYESRKVQAEKAQQSRLLQDQIFRIEVEVQLTRVHELMGSYSAKMGEISSLEAGQKNLKSAIDAANQEMEDAIDDITSKSRERIDMQTRIHRLDEVKNSKENQIVLLTDRIEDFEKSAKEARDRGEHLKQHIDRNLDEIDGKEQARRNIIGEIEGIDQEIRTYRSHVTAAEERIAANRAAVSKHEQSVLGEESRQEDLRVELHQLTEFIVIELDQRLKESGYSHRERKELEVSIREQTQALIMRLSGRSMLAADLIGSEVTADDDERPAALLRELIGTIDSSVESLRKLHTLFERYAALAPSFLDEFLAPEGIITRKRKNDSALDASLQHVRELKGSIQALREENRNLELKLSEYRQTLENLKISQTDMKGRADSLQSVIVNLKRSVQEQELLLEDSNKDVDVSLERMEETRERIARTEDELSEVILEEKQLQQELYGLVKEIEQRNEQVRSRRELVNTQYAQLSALASSAERLRAEREAIEHELSLVYEAFEDAYGRNLKEFSGDAFEPSDDVHQLRTRLKSAKQELQNLGYINHMAEEEFKEVKERYDFLTRQIQDLEHAKKDLKRITDEITAKSEELFSSCYSQIRMNFHAMFRRLFGGGRAELKLIEPDNLLHSGIDILAQPPGKKLEKISLLSGGERSLTAVALLFATYMVKPSPFCILDEIDAALDDANIGHFLSVLQEFSENSQFIIITHNKKTVLGSKTLLGVTMEEAGVSKAVSYRIQDIEKNPATHIPG